MLTTNSLRLAMALAFALAGSTAWADPPNKKPVYPPPEQSGSVGVLGGHHAGGAAAGGREAAEPPGAHAAPEVPKVEAEPPAPLPAAPREAVESDQPATGAAAPLMPTAPMEATGFLAEHPVISGLLAGVIGTDLGSKLYGGPMMGDRTATLVGYGIRVAAILLAALALFRLIGRRAAGDGEGPLSRPPARREPSFGKSETPSSGRREPTFGPRRD